MTRTTLIFGDSDFSAYTIPRFDPFNNTVKSIDNPHTS
jgi:hypothetical protein